MTVQSDGLFNVDMSRSRMLDLNQIRGRRAAVMPDGEHAWVIGVMHAIGDPEQALDSMVLGGESFVGITDIHCLLCIEIYETGKRHHKCPQRVEKKS